MPCDCFKCFEGCGEWLPCCSFLEGPKAADSAERWADRADRCIALYFGLIIGSVLFVSLLLPAGDSFALCARGEPPQGLKASRPCGFPAIDWSVAQHDTIRLGMTRHDIV
eukprot:SAG11_NODE_659_length_7895_cov_18.189969_7_plen_110_part_00